MLYLDIISYSIIYSYMLIYVTIYVYTFVNQIFDIGILISYNVKSLFYESKVLFLFYPANSWVPNLILSISELKVETVNDRYTEIRL